MAKKIRRHLLECPPATKQALPTRPEVAASASNLPRPNQVEWYQHKANTSEEPRTERADQITLPKLMHVFKIEKHIPFIGKYIT
jgi:hypothetical protein